MTAHLKQQQFYVIAVVDLGYNATDIISKIYGYLRLLFIPVIRHSTVFLQIVWTL